MLPTSKRSPFKTCKKSQYLRLAVEFDDFANVVLYRCGEYQQAETIDKFWGYINK
ncbi:MAG: hypothetical protein ACI9UT_001644 [Flavobacteriales bacterium]|jgi:hypothetical protein